MNKFILGALVLGAAVAAAPAAEAATHTVCAKGCSSSTIQGAIGLAAAGDTIDVRPGTYAENVVVDRSLTLRGHGDASVILPAVSGPTCADGSSLCPGASTLVLVQADDVTITGLRLQGDNPALTSGVVVDGADVDARNGIVTNHLLGKYENLTVSDVTVGNVYFRGIYASSGGSFTFSGNRVHDVQGGASSIAIFNFGGSGRI
jgi:nitrous oxidase accessory protein NosD